MGRAWKGQFELSGPPPKLKLEGGCLESCHIYLPVIITHEFPCTKIIAIIMMFTIYFRLTCIRSCAWYIIDVIPLNSYNTWSFSFLRWGNNGSYVLNNLYNVTQLISGSWVWNQTLRFQSLCSEALRCTVVIPHFCYIEGRFIRRQSIPKTGCWLCQKKFLSPGEDSELWLFFLASWILG